MQPVTAAKVKYGIWGLIVGAIIAMIVGFVGGGVDNHGHCQNHVQGGGLGESVSDLCRPIYEAA
jgi:hypothetical protein